MTEATEFESRADWQWNRVRTQENGSFAEEMLADVKFFVAHETWASLRADDPEMLAFPDETMEIPQIPSPDGLSSGLDRWGFVCGLLETPTSKGHVIKVEMPSDHWSWCGDPAFAPRICLKKRISILSHFGG